MRAAFSVSQNGTLVYRQRNAPARLQWVDRGGRELSTVLAPDLYRSRVALSPDGTRLALSINDPRSGTGDLWLVDLERGIHTRLTSARRSESLLFRLAPGSLRAWDVDHDARRFLLLLVDPAEAVRPDEVVVGWQRLLSERGR